MKRPQTSRTLYWFHPHFFNWMGGHQYILEVALRLQTLYHYKVVLVTGGFSAEAKRQFARAHISILPLFGISTSSVVYWLFLPFFIAAEYYKLKFVYKLPEDALILSSMFPATVTAHLLTKRHVVLCYEPFAFFHDQNFLSGFSLPVQIFFRMMKVCYGRLELWAMRSAAAVITLSKHNQKWINQCYQIPHAAIATEGVDMSEFKHTANQRLAKKYHSQPVIFHATDYTKIKGTEFLIRALPYVVQQIPNLHVLISETLPNSPQKKTIVELIDQLHLSKTVEFLGFAPRNLLPTYFSLAKVIVQPSIQQSMNMTVIEAMACGTPIITSPEGKEQTRNGEAGYLVDPHQSKALAKAIIQCVVDRTKSAEMGKVGKTIIQQKFSWEAVTQVFAKQLSMV